MQDTFLCVNGREISVGRKAVFGHGSHFLVMFDAFPATFFVTANDELYFALGKDTFVLQCFQTIQTNDGRGFIVHSAATPNFHTFHTAVGNVVIDDTAKGRIFPTVAGRHDVEVREDSEILSFSENDFSNVIVVIMRFETHFFG